jgi:hypothetical protein
MVLALVAGTLVHPSSAYMLLKENSIAYPNTPD